jgi:hypothetical protein
MIVDLATLRDLDAVPPPVMPGPTLWSFINRTGHALAAKRCAGGF